MADLRSYVNLDCYSEHKDHIHWILSASEDVLQRRFGIQDDVDVQPSIPSSNVSDTSKETEFIRQLLTMIKLSQLSAQMFFSKTGNQRMSTQIILNRMKKGRRGRSLQQHVVGNLLNRWQTNKRLTWQKWSIFWSLKALKSTKTPVSAHSFQRKPEKG